MANSKISFTSFIRTFLQITELNYHTPLLEFLNSLSLIFYFTHMLSYLLKFKWHFDDQKLDFLSGVIFYSFFPNLLLFFNNPLITLLSYFISLILCLYYILYVLILTIFEKKIKRNLASVKLFKKLTNFYSHAFRFYFWILLLPSIEIFINPLFCHTSGSYLSCSDKLGLPFLIISAFAIMLSLTLGIIYVIIYQTHTFLNLNIIQFNINFLSLIGFVLRMLLPFLYQLYGQNLILIYYIFLILIGFTFLFDYCENFPMRTQSLSKFYVCLILFFFIFLFVKMIEDYSTFINEESVFILLILLGIMAVKLGLSLFVKKHFYLISHDFSVPNFLDYALEELIILFEQQSISSKNLFFLMGMLKSHAKNCKEEGCKFREKHMNKYYRMSYADQQTKINSFVAQKLSKQIDAEKKFGHFKQMEHMILKYISYLINSKLNPSKSLYEIMMIMSLFSKKSFLALVIVKILIKKAHLKIKEISRERSMSKNLYEDDKSLDTSTFFKMQKQKLSFETKMKKLLQEKIVFWEHYKEGFNSYEEIIAELYKLVKSIFHFQEKIQRSLHKTNSENFVTLKFSSIFYCIIMNHLQEAHKVEDEVENIKKRYIRINRDCLSPLSFLEDNLVTCEASFMKLDGLILDKSKNDQLAQFFGYKTEEIKVIKYITDFMPEIIASKHKAFLDHNFRRTRKEIVNSKSLIMTFAKEKSGFLFPIKIFLGHSLTHTTDFVMHAAMMKLNLNETECLLFQKNGLIIGCTEHFLKILKEVYENFALDSLDLLNIYSLIPKIKVFIENNNAFEHESGLVLRNLNATLMYPNNMQDIIELLKFKRDDFFRSEKNKNSYATSFYSYNTVNTNRSAKSGRSEKSNTTAKINTFFSRYNKTSATGSLNEKKEFLLQILNGQKDEANEATIAGLMDENLLRKRKLSFDLNFRSHRYGKLKDNNIIMCWLKVNNVGPVENAEKIEDKSVFRKSVNFEENVNDTNKVLRDESFSNSSNSKGIEMPKENVVQFGFEFEREANLSFFSDNKSYQEKLIRSENSFKSPKKEEEDEKCNRSFEKTEKDCNKEKKGAKTITTGTATKFEKTEKIMNMTNTETNTEKEKGNEMFLSLKYETKRKSLLTKNTVLTFPNSENKLEEKKGTAKFSVSSKTEANEKNRIEKLQSGTTEKGQMFENIDKKSQKASSVTTSKQSYAIFNTVKLIQKKYPRSIFLLIFSLVVQILSIILYCLIIYYFAIFYISDSYLPLQNAAINQCRINMGIDISGLAILEYEYLTDGLGGMTDFQNQELRRVMAICYNRAKELFYQDRNTKYSFAFASYLQQVYVPYADFRNPNNTKQMLWTDFTDTLLQVINTFVAMDDFVDARDYFKVFPRNFPSYATYAKQIRDSIQAEFMASIDNTSTNVVLVLSLIMSILAVCKVLELFVFSRYYSRITKLVNIFLRISPKEALNELILSKDILNILQNPAQSYLHYYYPEKYLCKKDVQIDNQEVEKIKLKKVEKKKKKKTLKSNHKRTSLFNLRSISKNRVYIFIFFTLTIGIGYFFSNYYFWTITAQNVSNLLQINTMFINLYIFSTTDLCFLNLLIREKAYTDTEYQNNPQIIQNHEYRLSYFYTNYVDRLTKLKSYVSSMPKYAFPARDFLKDNGYDTILEGDTCQNLKQSGIIITDVQMNYCDSLFNSASTTGILSLLNEFMKFQSQNPLGSLINESNITAIQKQKSDLKTYLNDSARSDIVIGNFYLSEELYIFYNYLNGYYLNVLYQQKNNLQTFIWITCTVFTLVMSIVAILTWNYLTRVYRHVAHSLTLIPYEKLVYDEQTVFLTKQFWKEHI